jgi:hypothetical protein
MWLEDHFGNGSVLQRNERVKLAASFWNNIGAGMVCGGVLLRQAARGLDENRHCDRGTADWLALLFNCQQHSDLYEHSTRRAPLGRRDGSDLRVRRPRVSSTAQGLHDAFRQLALATRAARRADALCGSLWVHARIASTQAAPPLFRV